MTPETTPAELKSILGADAERVSVHGKDLDLRPLNLVQVADALEVVARISSRGAAVSALLGGGDFDPTQMLLRGGRDVLDLVAIAVSDQVKYLDDAHATRADSFRFVASLDAAEGAKLLGEVYRTNKDFFLLNRETILPALGPVIGDAATLANAVAARLMQLLSRLLSNSSSHAGTGSQTSEAIASNSSTASQEQ